MVRAGADAHRLAGQLHHASLAGLLLSGYLALAGSGHLGLGWALVAGAGIAVLAATGWFLAERFARGSTFVEILASLELLAAALLSASLSFFLFLAAFVFFLVAAHAAGEIRQSARGHAQVARGGLRGFHARLSGLIFCASLVILILTAGLFFVLPRTANEAFRRFAPERFRLPGLASEVQLGQIGAILNRSAAAMHVRVIGPHRELPVRWRGMALTSFDGLRWSSPEGAGRIIQVEEGRSILADDDQRRRAGGRITYEVRLEMAAGGVLFLTGIPEVLWTSSASVRETPEGSLLLADATGRRLRYGAIGYLDDTRTAPRPGGDHLRLPALDPRVRALARNVTSEESSDERRARALESYLARSYQYTAELPSEQSSDPLAQFLFDRRKGHCEYFASALAVMLRSLGIPSRLVTGFHGGQLNPVTGWHLIRTSDAHAWVEAWVDGKGWLAFDPTPAVQTPRNPPLLGRLTFYADAAGMFWQDWVVDYSLERQVTLAERMQGSGRTFGARWLDGARLGLLRWRDAAAGAARSYGVGFLLLVLAAGGLYVLAPKARKLWRIRRRFSRARSGGVVASDATLLYSRMLDILGRRGYRKPAWFTPWEFVRCLPPSETAEAAAVLTAAYHDLRYGGRPEAASRMIELLDRLEHAPPEPGA